MQLQRVQLLNFCQHRRFDQAFHPGLIAVIGPNGSGKSNLVGAIRYLLLGENPNSGKLEGNISQLAPPSEAAYVKGELTHGPHRIVITRTLRPSSTKDTFELDGQIVARGTKDVTKQLADLTGLGTRVPMDAIMIPQLELFGFLRKTPAKRLEQLQKLFDTQRAKMIVDATTKELSQIELPGDPAVLATLREQLASAQQRAHTLQASAVLLIDMASIDSTLRAIATRLEGHATYQRLIAASRAAEARQMEALQRHGEVAERFAATRLAMDTLLAQQADTRPTFEEAQRQQEQATAWQTYRRAVQQHVETQQTRRQQLAALVEPELPPTDLPDDWSSETVTEAAVNTLADQTAQLAGELQRDRAIVTRFAATGLAECPTCGTPAATLGPRVQTLQAALPAREAQLAGQETRVRNLRTFLTASRQYRQNRTQLEAALNSADQTFYTTHPAPTVPEPTWTIDAVAAAFAERTQTDAQFTQLRTSLDLLERETTATRSAYDSAKAVADAAAEAVAGGELTASEQAELEEQRTSLEATKRQRYVVEGDLHGVQSSVAMLQQSIAVAEQQIKLAEKTRVWQERLQAQQTLFHWENAPKLVIYRGMQWLQQVVNQQLELFQTNFSVEVDPEIAFVGHFHDGRVQGMDRLSPGQQVVLALANALALNSAYAADVGFLTLDEPTAYLDAHHIRGFEPVLSQLRSVTASRGLQCVIVTHEASLAPLFDQVIQL